MNSRDSKLFDVESVASGPLGIWTVGHSTRSIVEFLELLKTHGIKVLADVRQFPSSRKYPQFNRPMLSASLEADDIEYLHFLELGGRRKLNPNSENTLWRNESFRAYADYMETESFQAGIDRLLQVAVKKPTAIMCAEAVWWRCHRSLISDYLKSIGVEVTHIIGVYKDEPHPYTSPARIVDGKLSYKKYL